jgi:hypothetical protein
MYSFVFLTGNFISDTIKLLDDVMTSEICAKDRLWEHKLKSMMKLFFETTLPVAINSSVISETILAPMMHLYSTFTAIPTVHLNK